MKGRARREEKEREKEKERRAENPSGARGWTFWRSSGDALYVGG